MSKVKYPIILASRSPWRKRLLRKHGIEVRIHVSNFEEMVKSARPRELVLHNAKGKARDVARYYKNAIVIGVDTIGVLGKHILGKPKNKSDERRMIKMLAGTAHKVISGLCVINTKTGKEISVVAVTKVVFRKIGAAELEKYLKSNHWSGKAGSYAIQGRAKGFVERIEGDVTNVIGLPMGVLKNILRKYFCIIF